MKAKAAIEFEFITDEHGQRYEFRSGRWLIRIAYDQEDCDWFWTSFDDVAPVDGESGFKSSIKARTSARQWWKGNGSK